LTIPTLLSIITLLSISHPYPSISIHIPSIFHPYTGIDTRLYNRWDAIIRIYNL
jgi:hypothetical protein